MPRYDDQPDYNRPRDSVRRNDGRDVRRATELLPSLDQRRTAQDRGDYHMDDPMDMRIDIRPDPSGVRAPANAGVRREAPVRGIDPRERDVLYRDPRTGELYRDVPSRRTPYENEFDDMQPSSRPIVISGPEPGQPKPSYNEYFVPGEGIEREVIQAEICRYLGHDATCRPGKNPKDGRSGYLVKAYRALTTEMIRSLQESSTKLRTDDKFWADREKQRRRPNVAYTPIQDNQYDRDVDMDDDDRSHIPLDRYSRDMDPRDARNQISNRQFPPVTSGYMPEPNYPGAYSISTIPSTAPPPMGFEPRAFASVGNTTPPSGPRTTAYPPPDFATRPSQPAAASVPAAAQSYVDPRTGKVVSSYPTSSYPADGRHRR